MQLAALKESAPGERRVALAPPAVAALTKAGWEVLIETRAGAEAGFTDEAFREKGAQIVPREEALAAQVIAAVKIHDPAPLAGLKSHQIVVGQLDPLGAPKISQALAATGATIFALELIPRTTRAQAMDVLSSMATVAGYRAVLLAAVELPKMFPLMMTAAGTVTPAKVLVLGAGVAGLQAIATAKRLGAVVQGYDVRPACREQVESLGGKFIELGLEATEAEDKGGYAKAQSEDFARRQQDALGRYVAENDIVITTAAIPGQKSPVLFLEDAVARMRPGSVIVDLAAERGGNCPLTRPGERIVAHDVTILGPLNLPGEVPADASLMFGNNVANYLKNLLVKGKDEVHFDDDIVAETLVGKGGEVVHPRVRRALGIEPSTPSAPDM
jgi:H+-translocating NAD(P) transhydrogenase subunit alpha